MDLKETIPNREGRGTMEIYEVLRPGDIYILEHDDGGILYVGNNDGEPICRRAEYNEG